MAAVAARAVDWTESGLVPDSVIRHGIRRLLRARLADIAADDVQQAAEREAAFIAMMDRSAIALVPHLANEQHYEVPAAFFARVLGDNLKYSCCYWSDGVTSLSAAESAALAITCERAGIENGMHILDLGCGWGSFSIWTAEHFPECRITSVSNSQSQRDFIVAEAKRRGLENIEVRVCDMNDFDIDRKFHRIVSIEMFEHMRNYRELFRRIARWLRPDGSFFLHIFCHRSTPYEFTDNGPGDWMSRHFFSGGIMPSDSLPMHFQDSLQLQNHWRWQGSHYARTANAWVERMDADKEALLPVLAATYGDGEVRKWWMRWRMFFMACAELFAFNNGQEWWVSHYRFVPRPSGNTTL
jgi:cyclopropane-fatty-acyl-phospholipid synthase